MRRVILNGGRRLVLAGLVGLIGGCGGASPAAPSQGSVAGTWKGTMASGPTAPASAVTVTLSQSGGTLSGSWSFAAPEGPASGSLTGGAIGALVALTLVPALPTQCPYTINTTVSGARMTGVYASTNCTVVSSGVIELNRQ